MDLQLLIFSIKWANFIDHFFIISHSRKIVKSVKSKKHDFSSAGRKTNRSGFQYFTKKIKGEAASKRRESRLEAVGKSSSRLRFTQRWRAAAKQSVQS